MQNLGQDLRQAVRLLIRDRGFTAVAVLTLALGIGANTAIFSVVDAVLLRPLPFPQPEQVTVVYSQFPGLGFDKFWVSPPEYLELREAARSFADVGAYATGEANVTGEAEPLRVNAGYATASLFPTLQVEARHGRTFSKAEDEPNAEPVVVLSDGLWRRAFAADPQVVGRSIEVDGRRRTVIGVLPAGFDLGGRQIELWATLNLGPLNPQQRGSHYLNLVGRRKPGVSVEAARAEIGNLVRHWSTERADGHTLHPERHPLVVKPMLDDLTGGVRPALLLLLGAVGLLLLTACANVANLLLARAEARQREIAVRTALGAGQGRLIRQFLTESLLLALLGGAAGLGLAVLGLRAIQLTQLQDVPRLEQIGLDGRSLAVTLGLSILTGLLFGLAPALHTRTKSLAAALKSGGQRTTADAGRQLVRRGLVVAEIALAACLVIAGGLLIRSFWTLQQVDPGFRPEGVLHFQLSPADNYTESKQVSAFYENLLPRLASLPGVTSVAAMTGLPPLREVNANDTEFEGVPEPPAGPAHNVDYWQFVTPDYFKTMQIDLVAGRAFTPADGPGAPGVAIVNQTLAKVFWPNQDPIGRRLRAPGSPTAEAPWLTVIGVARDVKQGGLDQKTGTEVYFPYAQGETSTGFLPRTMHLVLRTQGDPESLAAAARSEVNRLDPALPLADLGPLAGIVVDSMARPRFLTFLVFLFAAVALSLAAVGTYGVMAWSVGQRRQEIGVRIALGARVASVVGMVMGQGARLVVLGLLLGGAGALALRKVLASVLFGVTPTDPLAYVGVAVVLLGVALFACWLPARRAAHVDPISALRGE